MVCLVHDLIVVSVHKQLAPLLNVVRPSEGHPLKMFHVDQTNWELGLQLGGDKEVDLPLGFLLLQAEPQNCLFHYLKLSPF